MITVLYINVATHSFDGATYSLADMIESLEEQVLPIVLLRSKGNVYDYFTNKGIECIVCDFEPIIYSRPKNVVSSIVFALKYIPLLIRFFVKNKKCSYKVSRLLRSKNIRIIHTNNSVLTIGCSIARKTKAKHVWHFRGFMDLDFGWIPLMGWRYFKRKIRKTDAIIGVTKTVLEHFTPAESRNAYVIFDAVRSINDTSLFFHKEKYFLFCSANLCKTKGVEFAIKAFALSKLSDKGYRLRLVGNCDMDYKGRLKLLSEKYDVSASIDFIGHSENVKKHMEKATAFLMCSQNEGMGRVTIEAMFYGCLVIGRNSGGTKDIVENGVTGFLFDDLDECSALMRKSIVSGTDNMRIIKNAQHYACTNFSIEEYGNKIMTIYNNVLKTSNNDIKQ